MSEFHDNLLEKEDRAEKCLDGVRKGVDKLFSDIIRAHVAVYNTCPSEELLSERIAVIKTEGRSTVNSLRILAGQLERVIRDAEEHLVGHPSRVREECN